MSSIEEIEAEIRQQQKETEERQRVLAERLQKAKEHAQEEKRRREREKAKERAAERAKERAAREAKQRAAEIARDQGSKARPSWVRGPGMASSEAVSRTTSGAGSSGETRTQYAERRVRQDDEAAEDAAKNGRPAPSWSSLPELPDDACARCRNAGRDCYRPPPYYRNRGVTGGFACASCKLGRVRCTQEAVGKRRRRNDDDYEDDEDRPQWRVRTGDETAATDDGQVLRQLLIETRAMRTGIEHIAAALEEGLPNLRGEGSSRGRDDSGR